MVTGRTRYELRVATLLSRAALATFRVPVRTTVMPRSTVYRFRVVADRDPSTVLDRLTQCNVEILGIRRCAEPGRREPATAQVRQDAPPAETEDAVTPAGGVVIPFPARPAPCAPEADPAPGGRSSAEQWVDPDGGGSAG
jgi:hypothetical protein